MKRYIVLVISILYYSLIGTAQDTIQIDMPEKIIVGEAFQLKITVTTETGMIQSTILAGAQRYDVILTVDSSGQTIWGFEEGHLTQAGTALIFIQSGGEIATFPLEIEAAPVDGMDLFATGNNIIAYGSDQTQIIAFIYDRYGNPIHNQVITITSTAPDGSTSQNNTVGSTYGRANGILNSLGDPGVLRIMGQAGEISQALHIQQFPDDPATINLAIQPPCILNDGLEAIRLQATAFDAEGNLVREGTQLVFIWENGRAWGTTINGIATVSLPAPEKTGTYNYSVQASVASDDKPLQVVEAQCP